MPPVFELIAAFGEVAAAEMWEVFNMGCGFCAVVPAEDAERAVALLAALHPGTAVIGRVTDRAGVVSVPGVGIEGEGGRIRARLTILSPRVPTETLTDAGRCIARRQIRALRVGSCRTIRTDA